MVRDWELHKIKDWSTNTIRNYIWMAVSCDQPVPGCVSVEALRAELKRRGGKRNGLDQKWISGKIITHITRHTFGCVFFLP